MPEKIHDRVLNNVVSQDNNDKLCRSKFVDDVTTAEAVKISTLTLRPIQSMIGPLPFNDSSKFELSPENSLLQKEIVKAKETSDDLQMVLNSDKTKIFTVNPSLNYQFIPRMRIKIYLVLTVILKLCHQLNLLVLH